MADHCRVIAACGHEAAHGAALRDLVGPEVAVVSSGRELFRTVAGLRRRGEEGCVIPMTLGRDPELVADTARTLRALPAADRSGVLLTEPFGTAQHLTGWLRAAAGRVSDTSALLVTAPAGDPFEDAELYRIAALVRRYGRHALVEVAFGGGDPDLTEGVRRCRLLGASRVTLLPAAFVRPDAPEVSSIRTEVAGPIVPPSALTRVLAERAADARRRWRRHGDDGVGAGLAAADHHGHNHTHPPGEGHDHGHGHGSGHGHSHSHAPGEDHSPPQRRSPGRATPQVIRSTA
ncbi:cobalamin biosynthesis protein CbiX [Streptomyces sp. DT171]|uniref:cobalamin biosynthesis protein CbiX n=1 Tax=Streptomyces sp. DT171 TaxID=3416524 RepID=UPI003CEF12FF